jgi:AcrR family transcriptional regulator
MEAFKLARKYWLEGKRISLGDLAKELEVSRGTLYRWVGNKDLLIDEIIWAVAKPTFEWAIRGAAGQGIDHIVEVQRRFMTAILSSPPLQQFVDHDPSYALRILTRDARSAHERTIKAIADHIQGQIDAGHVRLALSAHDMAAIIVRTNESLIYNDIISGRSPAIEQACALTRILLSAERFPESIGRLAKH